MTDTSALQLLNVWRARLSSAERGITTLPPQVIAASRRFVAELENLAPETRISIETYPQKWVFKQLQSGAFVGQIDFEKTAEQAAGVNAE